MRTVCSIICALLVSACSGSSTPPDGGSTIVVPDGAMPEDAGSDGGTDAGSDGGTDAGPETCGSTRFDSRFWPPLPETCLPLCSADTRDALLACEMGDVDCLTTALQADTTPPVYVDTYYGALEVSCFGEPGVAYACGEWQQYSCDAEHCMAEYTTWASCTSSDCTAEADALQACREASSDWQTCFSERFRACLP